ncbi:hypothetical protein CDL15_Pgr027528 [Punica granatum]|nr:hypothetical protein CDL15_Pgr027528 [Punica granatum]
MIVPVGRQFGYALFYKRNIQALKGELEKLHDARVGFETRCDAAVRNGEIVENEVSKWLDDVMTEEENANKQLKDWKVVMKRCFHGWIPNPKTRYVIGRKAKKVMLAIQELRGEGNFQVISHPDVPEGAVIDPTTFQISVKNKLTFYGSISPR